MNGATDLGPDESGWEYLLDNLAPLDFLLLEQIYVVERAPVALRTAQRRLAYLNLTDRTVSRHALGLANRHLLDLVTSCETLMNPIPRIQANAEVLVRIWRHRQQLSLQSHMAAVGQRTLDEQA